MREEAGHILPDVYVQKFKGKPQADSNHLLGLQTSALDLVAHPVIESGKLKQGHVHLARRNTVKVIYITLT